MNTGKELPATESDKTQLKEGVRVYYIFAALCVVAGLFIFVRFLISLKPACPMGFPISSFVLFLFMGIPLLAVGLATALVAKSRSRHSGPRKTEDVKSSPSFPPENHK